MATSDQQTQLSWDALIKENLRPTCGASKGARVLLAAKVSVPDHNAILLTGAAGVPLPPKEVFTLCFAQFIVAVQFAYFIGPTEWGGWPEEICIERYRRVKDAR